MLLGLNFLLKKDVQFVANWSCKERNQILAKTYGIFNENKLSCQIFFIKGCIICTCSRLVMHLKINFADQWLGHPRGYILNLSMRSTHHWKVVSSMGPLGPLRSPLTATPRDLLLLLTAAVWQSLSVSVLSSTYVVVCSFRAVL